MTEKFEYIKCYWKYIDKETPIISFYEVDLQNERYGVRVAEVFIDRTVSQVVEKGFDFVTEAPVPTINEINKEPEFAPLSCQQPLTTHNHGVA